MDFFYNSDFMMFETRQVAVQGATYSLPDKVFATSPSVSLTAFLAFRSAVDTFTKTPNSIKMPKATKKNRVKF